MGEGEDGGESKSNYGYLKEKEKGKKKMGKSSNEVRQDDGIFEGCVKWRRCGEDECVFFFKIFSHCSASRCDAYRKQEAERSFFLKVNFHCVCCLANHIKNKDFFCIFFMGGKGRSCNKLASNCKEKKPPFFLGGINVCDNFHSSKVRSSSPFSF